MYPKFFKKTAFVVIVICLSFPCFSQSMWNATSFKFTKDVSVLEDMTGATAVTFTTTGLVTTSPSVSFGGFSFRYGLSSYNNFYISPYGFVKLGTPIVNNNAIVDTNVIAPLNSATFWNAGYKMFGTAPNRKMVVQYTGVMQPSGEPTSYQVWLFERTGKIQFVYEQLRGYYGYPDVYKYKIFCGANIMGKRVVAAAKTNPNNALPAINYTAVPLCFDSIYPNTRYTFQPDTLRPQIPSALTYTNVQPGCMTVNITENSNNESMILLQRSDDGTAYLPEKEYYTVAPAGFTTYAYQQTFIQPLQTYYYRTFVSNGFLNSDTISNSVQTPMPLLNGIKTVPGDYPTITALLADAACKHLGPNLVIEMQNNYSFAAETLPLSFKSILQNRLIQSIVIRPAANAVINWTGNTSTALVYVIA